MPIRQSNAPRSQVANDLYPLQGVDIGMKIARPDILIVHVFRQVLGHALGQRGDQNLWPLAAQRRASASRSSTWLSTGRKTHSGSIRPVGRTTCSTRRRRFSNSQSPGVAET